MIFFSLLIFSLALQYSASTLVNYTRGIYPFRKALIVFAHPDDAETIAGGLIAQFIDQGIQVSYVVSTNGDKGWNKDYNMTSPQLAIIRQNEQLAAASVMGVQGGVTFLGNEDGRLEGVDPIELKMNVTIAIRLFQPDVVVTFSPETDYSAYLFGLMHRDHQTTGRAAVDSVWPACRDYLDFIQLYEDGILPWTVPQLWLFNFGQVSASDMLININGEWLQKKYNALLQHQSQYSNATDVYNGLLAIGQSIAAKNGLDPTQNLVEAYQVITIL